MCEKRVDDVKELDKNATEATEGFLRPTDIDEVKVEQQEDGLDGAPYSIKASLCCNYKPGLLSDLRRVLEALHLSIVKAEIATLEGSMKNIFVMASCKELNFENTEVCQSLVSSVHQAIRSVLDKFSATEEFLLGAKLSNKRRRVSLFDSSLSSSSDYLWHPRITISRLRPSLVRTITAVAQRRLPTMGGSSVWEKWEKERLLEEKGVF
ncbi:hypothetical protein CISIN_1g037071mg [Citrus sinensis]|uniref:ACT domain-containing protein n=1 Tax=Citrus sinensis TaxID=2711 RepID=A0A067EBM8_CITSI|nr:hypothetical protein CISIN_1g037071mg [Citrus sinensis]